MKKRQANRVNLLNAKPELKQKIQGLLLGLASDDPFTRYQAKISLASFIGAVAQKVIDQSETLTNWFVDLPFGADDNQTIPLDLFYDKTGDEGQQMFRTWSQSAAGSLMTNRPLASQEIVFDALPINTALAFSRRHVAKARLDVVAASINRALQAILNDRTRLSAEVFFGALANAEGNLAGTALPNVIRGEVDNQMTIKDFNNLKTLMSRLNTSWFGGTPAQTLGTRGTFTEIAMSPNRASDIRMMAFNSQNSQGDDVASSDNFRDGIYQSAGLPNIYGINLIEWNELDILVGSAANSWARIFEDAADGKSFDGLAFDKEQEELVLGIDSTRDSLFRPYETDDVSGVAGEVRTTPDDQFFARQEEFGYSMGIRQGNVITDTRGMAGLIIGRTAEVSGT